MIFHIARCHAFHLWSKESVTLFDSTRKCHLVKMKQAQPLKLQRDYYSVFESKFKIYI